MEMKIKRLWIHFYRVIGYVLPIERCKKQEPLKPMGIGHSVYPPDYVPPTKRVYSDGTVEYYIDPNTQHKLDEAWKEMGKEGIAGKSKMIKKVK